MSLQSIEQTLAAAAKDEWARIKAEGIVIEQELVADAKSTFELLTEQFAPLIMQTISSLAVGELSSLSGNEKANLSATTLVDGALAQGVTLLAADATAMVKNGFEAFRTAAPALGAPAAVVAAAEGALDAGEKVVEGEVTKLADQATAAVEGPKVGPT